MSAQSSHPVPPPVPPRQAGGDYVMRWPRLFRLGKWIALAGPALGLGGVAYGMFKTFVAVSDDISVAAGQITGGVLFAVVSAYVGVGLAVVGIIALSVGRLRAPLPRDASTESPDPSA